MENSSLLETNTRECSKCGLTKQLLEFSFRTDTGKYRTQCMQCTKGYLSNLKVRRMKTAKLFQEGKKECSLCHEVKDLTEYSKDATTVTGYCSRCKNCLTSLRNDNIEHIKFATARSRYGVTKEYYEELMQVPNCQICNISFIDTYRCIDHCHTTKAIRGVLCMKCNTGLGKLGDSIEAVEKVLTYLKSTRYGNV